MDMEEEIERFPGDHQEISVVGMGYVGSSLSTILADSGFSVYGVDVDPELVGVINGGECPIQEKRVSELFEEHVARGNIRATTSYEILEKRDTIIVTVGTPLAEENPDLSSIEEASRQIGPYVREGDVVIFRSTLPAGATEETVRPILNQNSGLTAGEDYALAFCPERMAEGNAYRDLTEVPVVVGGLTDGCTEAAQAFWRAVGLETVAVSSPRAAELTKLADNWWIDLNIALANEIALLSEKTGVDALEVIHAANTLPKGEHHVNILFPGAGVGGSCLVKDPWFVAKLGDRNGLTLQTPRVSRRVNERMPEHVADLVREALKESDGRIVSVLGYAFKGGTNDTRNTPTKVLVEILLADDIDVRVTDPYVSDDSIVEEIDRSASNLSDALEGTSVVVIMTDHQAYKDLSSEQLVNYVGTDDFIVVDGRHVFEPGEFDGTGVKYVGVGRGSGG